MDPPLLSGVNRNIKCHAEKRNVKKEHVVAGVFHACDLTCVTRHVPLFLVEFESSPSLEVRVRKCRLSKPKNCLYKDKDEDRTLSCVYIPFSALISLGSIVSTVQYFAFVLPLFIVSFTFVLFILL